VKELPTGYYLELGGQFENQQRAIRQLAVVVPVALLFVLLLLYLALGTLGDALLVLLNLPFALVLLGIAVQKGVVLVAFFRQLRKEGKGVTEAVREGSALRFRPLLMTALTSFIGHLPMLYATGSGADIQKPLAVVVMGGLITSTALTLLVLPAIYAWKEQRPTQRQGGRRPSWPSPTATTPPALAWAARAWANRQPSQAHLRTGYATPASTARSTRTVL